MKEKILVLMMAMMVWKLIYTLSLDGFNDELTQILVHVKLERRAS